MSSEYDKFERWEKVSIGLIFAGFSLYTVGCLFVFRGGFGAFNFWTVALGFVSLYLGSMIEAVLKRNENEYGKSIINTFRWHICYLLIGLINCCYVARQSDSLNPWLVGIGMFVLYVIIMIVKRYNPFRLFDVFIKD